MKNSSNRLIQLLKWTSPLALVLLAVSWSQTARAQLFSVTEPAATFTDMGGSNAVPIPGPNDLYQTNALSGAVAQGGSGSFSYYDNNLSSTTSTQYPAGETFYLAPIAGAAGYTVTNLFLEMYSGQNGTNPGEGYWDVTGTGVAGGQAEAGSIQWTNAQQYRLNFYQISGAVAPALVGSNATLIASILTTPGKMFAGGDWMSISNFQVFLAPGTTNAFTMTRTTNGGGYQAFALVPNGVGTWPGLFAAGEPICIAATNSLNAYGNTFNVGQTYNVNYGFTVPNNNSIPLTNYDAVFSIGIATNFQAPLITTNPASYVLAPNSFTSNLTVVFSAGATGGSNSPYGISGYWLANYGSGWVAPGSHAAATPSTVVSGFGVPAGGAMLYSTLSLVNITSADIGSYEFVATNSPDGVTTYTNYSTPATIAQASIKANSFEDVVLNQTLFPTLPIGYWPLNEAVDPSSGKAESFEIVGGNNGTYGWNAANGASNTLELWPPAFGPALPGLTNTYAYGGKSTSLPWGFITYPTSPTLTTVSPTGGQATMIAWIYPTVSEPSQAGLIVERGGPAGAGSQNNGFYYGGNTSPANCLGWTWDNGNNSQYGYNSKLNIPLGMWSMVAMVVNPNNANFYVCNTNAGIISTQTNQVNSGNAAGNSWGQAMTIGTDMYSDAGRTFQGYISSAAFLATNLTTSNIEQLFNIGLTGVAGGSQMPFFTANPSPNFEFINSPSGNNATFTASAYGGSAVNVGWWQVKYASAPSVWLVLTNGGNNGADVTSLSVPNGNYTNLTTGTLSITNVSSADAGTYVMVVSNLFGNVATSLVATIAFVSPSTFAPPNSFAAAITNAQYGLVSYWPLNESGDPSLGQNSLEAFDVIGGHNGYYGTNAQVGTVTNSFIAGYQAGRYLLDTNTGIIPGPSAAGLSGLPSTAFGSIQNISALATPYITVGTAATFPGGDINQSIIAWIYPDVFVENGASGILFQRSGGSGQVDGFNYYNGNGNTLGYTWDNNSAYTYNYNTTLSVPSNMWSMVALVINASNSVWYVANTNMGLATTNQWMTNASGVGSNTASAWGGVVTIGTDLNSSPTRNFGGLMSSVAMFSNALSYAQIATLFDTGLTQNNQRPFITQQPLSAKLYTNFAGISTVTFTAAGYGGSEDLTNGGYWQVTLASGGGLQTINGTGPTGHVASSGTATNTNTLSVLSTLVITNATIADAGSYQFVVTNSASVAATSAQATLTWISALPALGSYASNVITTPGVVAYWPLNETGNPSTGTVEAFDLVGAFNGLYGVNAQDGTSNTAIAAVLFTNNAFANDNYGAVPGPGAAVPPYTGFQNINSSLGSVNNFIPNSFVTTLASPSFPTNAGPNGASTNLTIIAWINPQTNEPISTGVVMQRTTSGQVDGLIYGGVNTMGSLWNNGPANSTLTVYSNTWNMVAMVVTGTNTSVYVGNTNGVNLYIKTVNNTNQVWGGPITIGGDPLGAIAGSEYNRSFGGYVSSVAMFTNALSLVAIENLFVAGLSQGVYPPPTIAVQPPSTNLTLLPGITENIVASGFGFGIEGYWQQYSPTANPVAGWTNLANGTAASGRDVGGATTLVQSGSLMLGTLTFSNVLASDAGSYRMVVTNSLYPSPLSGAAVSYIVQVTVLPAPTAGSFASVITNLSTYGTVSYWPLNEASDPSVGGVIAWDNIGGFNGVYGTNAQNGASNNAIAHVLTLAAGPAYDDYGVVPGPGAAGFTGLPATALGSMQKVVTNTYVTVPVTATLQGLNGSGGVALPNSTNVTLVAWINPQINGYAGTSILAEEAGQLGANRTDIMFLNSGPILSDGWDNNTIYNFAGPAMPLSNYSMVAVVISPSNMVYYVGTNHLGTNNVLVSLTQTTNNMNEPFGAGIFIGGEPGNTANGNNGVSFPGFISSVAFFSNSLNVYQLENLFVAGVSNGVVPAPVIVNQPAVTNIELITGGSLAITAAGFAAISNNVTGSAGGYWATNSGGVWRPIYTTDVSAPSTNLTLTNALLTGVLQFTNFQVADANSYVLILTNAGGSATSAVVNISAFNAPPGSFAAVATSPGYGPVSFWPLNEGGDDSTTTNTAFDVVGGFNGYWVSNAQNAITVNSYINNNAPGYVLAPNNPQAHGLLGLGTSSLGGFGSNAALPGTYVSVPTGPALPPGVNANGTNATWLAWVYPNAPVMGVYTGMIVYSTTGGQRDGMYVNPLSSTPTGDALGVLWNNTAVNNDNLGNIPAGMWSMVAISITSNNYTGYILNLANGITAVSNTYTPSLANRLGTGMAIGADPFDGAVASRNFAGYMADAMLFSNALTLVQIQNLFSAGEAGGAGLLPIITLQPTSIGVIAGNPVSLRSTAYLGPTSQGVYWQGYNPNSLPLPTWTNVVNGGNITGSTTLTTNGFNVASSLTFAPLTAANVGTYRVVFTNAAGTTASSPALVSLYNPAPKTFAAVLTNAAFGTVGYWPLGEQVDPSTGSAVAFDYFQGHNGIYGTNAQDGFANQGLYNVLLNATPSLSSQYYGAYDGYDGVPGPGAPIGYGPGGTLTSGAGYTGLPTNAFASINALQQTIITVPQGPSFATNATNASIICWFNATLLNSGNMTYPNGYCDVLMEVNGALGDTNGNNGLQCNVNGGVLQMAYDWDNDASGTHTWVTGEAMPTNAWSLYGLTISPTNGIVYLISPFGFQVATNNYTNINEPWPGGFQIGGNASGYPGSAAAPTGYGNFFNGAISSVAMFSNTLSLAQLGQLYAAGVALGNPNPVITIQPPFTSYILMTNGGATIGATAYAGPTGGGYWEYSATGSSPWTILSVDAHHASVNGVCVPNLSPETTANLVVTSINGQQAGYYQCVFTNSGNYFTDLSGNTASNGAPVISSRVLVITTSNPPLNSFAAVATTNTSFGLAALWTLNDYGDTTGSGQTDPYPPIGVLYTTYDVWGGWNGTYGTNAVNGFEGGTSPIPPATGPGTYFNIHPAIVNGTNVIPGFPPGDYALASAHTGNVNGSLAPTPQAYVYTAGSPSMPANSNLTVLAWVYPTSSTVQTGSGLVRLDSLGQNDGMNYGSVNNLGYTWNGVADTTDGGSIPSNTWSMVATVFTATNTTLYVFNTNKIINYNSTVTVAGSNAYQGWGLPIAIGGDLGNDPGHTFDGWIADVAIFTNALTGPQLGNLFYAGTATEDVIPSFSSQTGSVEIYGGRPVLLQVNYQGNSPTNQWQVSIDGGASWANVPGATTSTLFISHASNALYHVVIGTPGDAHTYTNTPISVVTESTGGYAYPAAVTNLNPLVYYRLNETPAVPGIGPLTAYDFWNGVNGTYGAVINGAVTNLAETPGVPGVNNTGPLGTVPLAFPLAPGAFEPLNGNTGVEFTNASETLRAVPSGIAVSNSVISIPSFATSFSNGVITNNFSIVMWINPNETQSLTNGLFYARRISPATSADVAGFGFMNTTSGALGYNWANAAGTYGWAGSANLIPASGTWNFVALVVTPSNATIYCYNTNSQQSVQNNTVANPSVAFDVTSYIGWDPYAGTPSGMREFDGSIDEVAIFNYALDPTNVNGLWFTGTGIPVPAAIQTPISGPTNFVNLDQVLTYTVGAVNGPLYYQWMISNTAYIGGAVQVLTNGANGYTGSLFSGATTASLSISNLPGVFAAQALIVSVTNSVSRVPATSLALLPQYVLPTPALWTFDLDITNGTTWNGVAAQNGYNGFGAIGTGTYWNHFYVTGVTGNTLATFNFTNNSAFDDTGTNLTGVAVDVPFTGYADGSPMTANALASLLDPFLDLTSGGSSAVVVTNLTPGYYNVFVYSVNGSWGFRGTTWNIGSTVASANNGPVQTIDTGFLLGQNYVIFTNVLTVSGRITMGAVPDTTAYFGTSGNTANEADFNGMQLQYIAPYAPMTFSNGPSASTLKFTWAGGALQAAGSVSGPWTNVTVGGVPVASPYTVPTPRPSPSAMFFRTMTTNTTAPNVPYIIGG